MTASDRPVAAAFADERLPDDLVEAGFYQTTAEGFDHSLVVLALGQTCWLIPSAAGYRLLVEPAVVNRMRAELASYDRESVGWPPRVDAETPARTRLDLVTPLFWAFSVLAVWRGQSRYPEWTDAGALDSAAIFGRGEWWRAGTALFLHADEAHLMSNLLAGVFAFAAVVTIFGRRRGWMLLGLASIVGNLAIAAAHYSGPYRSIGASTAIFAAIGLLTGRAARFATNTRHPHRWRSFFVPTATGLTVLALYGAGEPPVDVLAHVSGFLSGALAGFIAGRPEPAVASETRARRGAPVE